MKYLISFSLAVLIAVGVLSFMPVWGESEIYNDVLRLHVIAESDSTADQELKLKVRDAVLMCVSENVAQCENFDEAYEIIDSMKDDIRSAALRCVWENGEDCSIKVELGREKYPRREYDSAVLPAGTYNSLRVTLGEGEGKNWWCVLFPTICTGFAQKEPDKTEYIATGFTPEEYKLITGKSGEVKIRFKVLEMLSEILGFEY